MKKSTGCFYLFFLSNAYCFVITEQCPWSSKATCNRRALDNGCLSTTTLSILSASTANRCTAICKNYRSEANGVCNKNCPTGNLNLRQKGREKALSTFFNLNCQGHFCLKNSFCPIYLSIYLFACCSFVVAIFEFEVFQIFGAWHFYHSRSFYSQSVILDLIITLSDLTDKYSPAQNLFGR